MFAIAHARARILSEGTLVFGGRKLEEKGMAGTSAVPGGNSSMRSCRSGRTCSAADASKASTRCGASRWAAAGVEGPALLLHARRAEGGGGQLGSPALKRPYRSPRYN